MQNELLPMIISQHPITVCPHPFMMERVDRLAPFGLSLQEITDSIDELPKDCAMSMQVDGVPVYPDTWSSYYPSEGSSIVIRVLPMGGDEEGGKNPLRVFLTLVVLVASIWVGPAAGGGLLGALASAAVTMAGTLLINALCPPARSNLSERAGINLDGVVNSITNARNQANPFGPIPVLLGSHRIVPFYAARPYTEIVGNDQYLRLLFVPSYLPVTLSDFKIGETDLEDFEDVEIETKGLAADDDPTLYTNTFYEEAVNVELLEASGWTTRTTQANTDEIFVDVICPNGLCEFNAAGERTSRTVYYEIQYAVKDSGAWVSVWDYNLIAEHTEGPLVQYSLGDTIWRILLNLQTKDVYIKEGVKGTTQYDVGVFYPPVAPPVPQGSCSLAQVYISMPPTGFIADAIITDERDSDCLDQENIGDFLVSEDSPKSWYVTVAAGSYRLRPYLKGQTSEAVRTSRRIKVDQGQYDVRVKRVTADDGNPLIYDDLYWSILRSVTYESPVTKDDVALIAMRIKATDQLNGIIDTFNCVGTCICPDWDSGGSTWTERSTANPASLYRYVLQHPANKRAVADAKIDLTKLQEWHEFCAPTSTNPNAAGPAVDKGGGKVGIPCTGHPFSTNDTIYIINSVAYDDRYAVDGDSTTNEIVITATYASENFTGDEVIHTIGLQYNSLIDYQTSVSNVLQQIAAAGKASPTYVDGKYSVVIDQTQATPIQHFTPRNSWNFSGSKSYPRLPHAIRVIFANRLTNWEIDERIVYADGYDANSATLYEQLELPGVTDPELAYVLARYHLAVLTLRPERYSFYADVENLVSTRGDLIRVTHDVPLWGVSTGRITSVTDNGTHATAVVMDSIMTMAFGNTYGIRFRLDDGSTLLAAVDTNVGDQTTLTFTTPILLAAAPSADDLGLFGETDSESVELLILSIEPGEDLTAKITCVDYSPAVYTASTGLIGEHDSQITSPYSAIGRSGIPEIYNIRSNESVLYRDTDGSLRPKIVVTLLPVGGYTSEIAFTEMNWKVYDTDELWKTARFDGYTQEMPILDVEDGVEYTIRLRFILHNGDPTQWCTAEQHTVVGKTTAPDVPTAITANPVIAGVRIEWTNPTVLDFQYTGIWRAEADIFPGGTAKYVVPGSPGEVISFVDRDIAYTTTYYYWLKSYDTAGNASSESSSVNDNPYYVQNSDISDTIQSANYVSGVSGWFIGFRGANDGYAEFNDVTIRGTLIAGQIHIPDKTTADSFHVASDGDTWWGCSEANFNSSPANATAYVLKDGTVKFAGGTVGGWTLSATTIESTNITIDSANNRIRSSNYVSGVFGAGFTLESDLLEVGNIAARGMIRTAVFQKDVISAVGGNLAILPADTLDLIMAAGDGDALTRVTEDEDTRVTEDGNTRIIDLGDWSLTTRLTEDDNTRITEDGKTRIIESEDWGLLSISGSETLAIGDILRIKDGIDDEWLEVMYDQFAPDYYVLRDRAEAYATDNNPTWAKGATVVNYGASGSGGVYMTASESNAPYMSVFTHAGIPWSVITTHLRVGNLNGFLGYSTDKYGIAIGETTKYLKYDPTNGMRIAGHLTSTSGTIGGWTLGATSLTSTSIGLHSGANAEILLGHATTYASAAIGLKNDGSGKLASGNIVWTAGGDVTLGGVDSYLKWTAGALSVKMASGETFELYGDLDVKSGADIKLESGGVVYSVSVDSNNPGFVLTDDLGSPTWTNKIYQIASGQFYIDTDAAEIFFRNYEDANDYSSLSLSRTSFEHWTLISNNSGKYVQITGSTQVDNELVSIYESVNGAQLTVGYTGVTLNPGIKDSVLIAGGYLNFNATQGETGFGIRNDSGTMKYKNSGGAWIAFATGSGDVVGPANNTDGYIPTWAGADTKTLADGIAYAAGIITANLDGDATGSSGSCTGNAATASHASDLAIVAEANGDILYRGAANWERLAADAGKFLKSGTPPTWDTPPGTGDLLADGSVPLSANWDVGAFTITALRFVSDQATGTAPFTVASTTEVANLKAATATLATNATTAAHASDLTIASEAWGDILYRGETDWIRLAPDTGKYLKSQGAGSAVIWDIPAGTGDLLADGSIPLTANWDVGAYTITALKFASDQATGTAPFTVASTTEVANLKAATATLAAHASDLVISGETTGDVLYFDGSNWIRLAANAGKYLKSGTPPTWDNPTGGSGLGYVYDVSTYSEGTDTLNIQAAIDDAEAVNGTVWIPAGSYTVADNDADNNIFEITAGITIIGANVSGPSTWSGTNGTFLYTTATDEIMFHINTTDPVIFQDLTIQYGTASQHGQAGSIGIYFYGNSINSEIRHVEINGPNIGIHMYKGQRWKIRDCKIWGVRDYGIIVENSGNGDAGDSVIDGCYIQAEPRVPDPNPNNISATIAGILYKSGGGLNITNNLILSVQECIQIIAKNEGATGLNSWRITGNTLNTHLGTGWGVYVTDNGSGVQVNSAIISDNDVNQGIYLKSTTDPPSDAPGVYSIVISDNNMWMGAQYGTHAAAILVEKARWNVATGNLFRYLSTYPTKAVATTGTYPEIFVTGNLAVGWGGIHVDGRVWGFIHNASGVMQYKNGPTGTWANIGGGGTSYTEGSGLDLVGNVFSVEAKGITDAHLAFITGQDLSKTSGNPTFQSLTTVGELNAGNGTGDSYMDVESNGTSTIRLRANGVTYAEYMLYGGNTYNDYDGTMYFRSHGPWTTKAYLNSNGDLWINGNISFLSYTDRSPIYVGDNALDQLVGIKAIPESVDANGWGKVDHSTLPKSVQAKGKDPRIRHIKTQKEMKGKDAQNDYEKNPDKYEMYEVEVDERNLSSLLNLAVKAIVELKAEIDDLKANLN